MEHKLSRGVALLTVFVLLFLCRMVATARPEGVPASSGEELVITLITVPMLIALFAGLALIAWHLARD